MNIVRPLAVLSAAALALGCLGSATASAAPVDRAPRPAPRSAALEAPRVDAGSAGEPQLRRALAARAHRSTTTFSVKSSRAATARVRDAATALGASTPDSALARIGWTTVTVPNSQAAAARARLAATPGVVAVSEAQPRQRDYLPNDSRYATQQKTMMTSMQAPTAWDTARGAGVTIAVLDGGFYAAHPDLSGKVAATWDVVKSNTNVADSTTDTLPGHGTAAASVAAAATNNARGIAGAAPQASLLLIQVGDDTNSGEIFSNTSAAGILYAVDHGADVISMSYGGTGTPDQVEADAVAYAIAHDVVVVASAGNDGTNAPHYPAALAGVLAVGATTNNGAAQASWSTYGTWVDLAAPGESVPVALPNKADDQDGTVDGYSRWDGTSFSAPLVAGLAAVVRSYDTSATEAQVRSALTSTTKAITKTNSGYAHGLVQVANALAKVANPVITAPAPGDALTGRVAVSATSAAPSVKFSADGTTAATKVSTVAGSASGTFSTYGLSGAVTLRAQACNALACGTGSTVAVTVSNDPPVLTAPDEGAAVETSLTLAATSAGDAVKFLADGTTSLGVDKAAPFSLTVDTAALADGAHTITAVQCSADGLTCDTAHPSNSRSITVSRLRPTLKVSPNPFSPNADGRRDTATLTYTYETAQRGTLVIKTAGGSFVRSVTLGTNTSAGAHTWVWNGRNTAGTVVPDGTYTLELATTQVNGVKKGTATATVKLDRTKPVASAVAASLTSVYPYADGYRDTVSLSAKSGESVASFAVYITNKSGTRVRTITGGARPAGRVAVEWKGTTNSGAKAAEGAYAFQVMLQDAAGNQTLSAKGSITLSWKKLVSRTGTKTIPAKTSALGFVADQACNFVFSNARPGVWPTTSVAYESRDPENCAPNGNNDIAFTLSQYQLPAAIKYGTVKVSVYGGGSTAGKLRSHKADVGEIDYVLRDGSTIGVFKAMAASTATHAGPTVRASDYLVNGRTIKWWMGSANGNWYDVRDFTVTWTYYVLA